MPTTQQMHMNQQMQRVHQMQMMNGGAGIMAGPDINNPQYFYFAGTPQSLQARLDSLSDE